MKNKKNGIKKEKIKRQRISKVEKFRRLHVTFSYEYENYKIKIDFLLTTKLNSTFFLCFSIIKEMRVLTNRK